MSSRSVHNTKAKVNPIPFTALPEDIQKGHIPIIAIDYKDKDLAKEKELVVDFETGNLYITSKDDDTVLVNLLEVLAHDYLTNINGNKTWLTISGIEGVINLSYILSEINRYKIEKLIAENEDTAIKGRLDSINYDQVSIEEDLFVLLKDFDDAKDLGIPRKSIDGTHIEWISAKEEGLDPGEPSLGDRENIIDILPTPREPDQNVFVLYSKPYARSVVNIGGIYYVRLPKSIPTYHDITWKVNVKERTTLIFDDNIDWYSNKWDPTSGLEDLHSITILPDGKTFINDQPTYEPEILPGTTCNLFFSISTWDKGRRWQISFDTQVKEPEPLMVFSYKEKLTENKDNSILQLTTVIENIEDQFLIMSYDDKNKLIESKSFDLNKNNRLMTYTGTILKETKYIKVFGDNTKIERIDFTLLDLKFDKIVIKDLPNLYILKGISNNKDTLTTFSLGKNSITNMTRFFYNCTKLTSIPKIDTSKVTNMYDMFYNCTKLTSIPLFNTSKVTYMNYMFSSCTSLTSIPLLDTSKVTTMYNMFRGCTSLTSIPLLDTSNVTNMYGMFYNCTSLTSIPLLDTSKVTNMNGMFYNCTSLTSIPLLDTSKVTDMNGMFYNCVKLSGEITIKTTNITDFVNMFRNCSTDSTAEFIVDYIDDNTKTIAEKMVATKSSNSNVSIGTLVS